MIMMMMMFEKVGVFVLATEIAMPFANTTIIIEIIMIFVVALRHGATRRCSCYKAQGVTVIIAASLCSALLLLLLLLLLLVVVRVLWTRKCSKNAELLLLLLIRPDEET
jgi:hypothetical protein